MTPRTFFFLHVMKTGGTSFLGHLFDNFPSGRVEPDWRDTPLDEIQPPAYGSLSRLRELPEARRAELLAYAGHYPYFVTELVPTDAVLTVLRDPVDRAVSMLRQIRRHDPARQGASLEEIYDDEMIRPMLIQDYQGKLFAMTRADVDRVSQQAEEVFGPGAGPEVTDRAHMLSLAMDEERFAAARETLERVDVVGLQERYAELLDVLRDRFGWHFPVEHHQRHGSDEIDAPASASLRERIERDNAGDVELHRWALDRWDRGIR